MRNLILGSILCAAALLSSSAFAVDTGRATTSAPTYTTGTDNPLSLTVDGKLRVDSSGGSGSTANQGTPAANSNAWPVKTTVGATGAKSTSTLAGADATISASCPTCILRVITNVSNATAYLALGQTATSTCCIQLVSGATYFEDRFTGAIHGFGTGNVNISTVTP